MQERLAQSKDRLLAALAQIDGRPCDMDCAAEAKYALCRFGLPDGD